MAERIAGKSKYARNLYLQFEREDSWTRLGVRAFGRVNGGLVFQTAYLRQNKCNADKCYIC